MLQKSYPYWSNQIGKINKKEINKFVKTRKDLCGFKYIRTNIFYIYFVEWALLSINKNN